MPISRVRVWYPPSNAPGASNSYFYYTYLEVYDSGRVQLFNKYLGTSYTYGSNPDFFMPTATCTVTKDSEPTWVAGKTQTLLVSDSASYGDLAGTVAAADVDPPSLPAGALTYTLLSATPSSFSTLFTFSTTSGRINVKSSLYGLWSDDSQNTYTLVVSVADGLGVAAFDNATVTLAIRPAFSYTKYSCPSGWTTVEGSDRCYQAYTGTTSSWYNMKNTYCPSLASGATLASIRNEAEADFVITQRCGRPGVFTNNQFWIGLSDESSPSYNQYSWNDPARRGCCYSWASGADPSYIRGAGQKWWQSYYSFYPDSNSNYYCGLIETLNNWPTPYRLRNYYCYSGYYGCCEVAKYVPSTVTQPDAAPVLLQPEATAVVFDAMPFGAVVATVAAMDPDPSSVSAGQLAYTLVNASAGFLTYFNFDSTSGAVSVRASMAGIGSGANYTFSINVAVADKMGVKAAGLARLNITVVPAYAVSTTGTCAEGGIKISSNCYYVNRGPALTQVDAAGMLPRVTFPANAAVGATLPGLLAVDPDAANGATGAAITIAYRAGGGNGSALFTIDGSTGRVKVTAALTGRTGATYLLQVGCTDGMGGVCTNATLPIYIDVPGYATPGLSACPAGYVSAGYGSQRCYRQVTMSTPGDWAAARTRCANDITTQNANSGLARIGSAGEADLVASVCGTNGAEAWYDPGVMAIVNMTDARALSPPSTGLRAYTTSMPTGSSAIWNFAANPYSSISNGAAVYDASNLGWTGNLYGWSQITPTPTVPGGAKFTGNSNSYFQWSSYSYFQTLEAWVRFPAAANQNKGTAYFIDCRNGQSNAYIASSPAWSASATATTPMLPVSLIGDAYWPMNPGNMTMLASGDMLALDVGTMNIKANMVVPSTAVVSQVGQMYGV